jgi:3-hydroxybutyrate dehydrogenase
MNIRSNLVCPGFVLTPLVEKQIPEQAQTLGITEEEVIKNVMLKHTVDGQFTLVEDIAEICSFLADVNSPAFTGQSITASHGWNMS